MHAGPGFLLDILDSDTAPLSQALSRALDAAQKLRITLEPIIEPISSDPKPISDPAGLPLRVMTIPSPSASRKNRERSSSISDSGALLTPYLRIT
jgi:hypothetical protein